MAIMKTCCCFSNTRSGSMASGIYSLVFCIISLIWNGYEYSTLSSRYDGYIDATEYTPYIIDFVVAGFLFLASILLLNGVSKDLKCMLIPYMVAMSALILLQIISWIIILAYVNYWYNYSYMFVINIAVWIALSILNVFCLLCVISQYQELRDGRGRSQDVNRIPSVSMQHGVVFTTPNMTMAYPSGHPMGTGYAPQQAPVGYVQGPMYQPGYQPAPVGYPTAGVNPTNWQQPPPYTTATAPSQSPQPTKY